MSVFFVCIQSNPTYDVLILQVETCISFSEHINKSEQDELAAVEYLPDHQALFAISKAGAFLLCDCNTQKVSIVSKVANLIEDRDEICSPILIINILVLSDKL